MTAKDILEKFTSAFGSGGDINCFFAPGRINLIGDHTDYCGGHVFPCALSKGSYGAIRKRSDRQIRLFSELLSADGIIEASLDSLERIRVSSWMLVPFNIIRTFISKGHAFPCGFDIAIDSDLPRGTGLSFTASLDILMSVMLRDSFGFSDIEDRDLALYSFFSEENLGLHMCGLMDLCASALGKKDQALYLDTKKILYEYAPLNLGKMKIVITNSQVRPGNIRSIIAKRKEECAKALRKFQSVIHISALCDMNMDHFKTCKDVLMDDTLVKRARHVISENQRTIRALSVLKAGNIAAFGELMDASHHSLDEDYEVSCQEINLLVSLARKLPGVYGSRMTGMGFGGFTVSLVEESAIENFKAEIAREYSRMAWLDAEFFILHPSDGARQLVL
ncbi:MAG: galactokinase [Lachnospiraceae bacterium]|nr:galactokinase [Lachnospiraceae bacterium]